MYIHIGYPKTGSTTLQRTLLKLHPEIVCLNSISDDLYWELRNLFTADTSNWNPSRLKQLAAELSEANIGKQIILSDENILSPRAKDIGLSALRLKELFYPCEIMIIIRNQYDFLKSFFANHGRLGQQFFVSKLPDYDPPFTFDEWLDLSKKYFHYSVLPLIQYYDVIKCWQNFFGVEKVKVFLFEEFVNKKKAFSEKLSDYLNIDCDKTYEYLNRNYLNQRITMRRKNFENFQFRFWRSISHHKKFHVVNFPREYLENYLNNGEKFKPEFSKRWSKLICEMYSENNHKLEKEYGLPLNRYGYPC